MHDQFFNNLLEYDMPFLSSGKKCELGSPKTIEMHPRLMHYIMHS